MALEQHKENPQTTLGLERRQAQRVPACNAAAKNVMPLGAHQRPSKGRPQVHCSLGG